jgi:hypothetical protein
MLRSLRFCSQAACLSFLLGVAACVEAAMSVSLQPSVSSFSKVGALVTWTASAGGGSAGTLWYRFRARPAGAQFHMVRDYGPENRLDWTSLGEGDYEIEASIRNRDTDETAVATAPYHMASRVTGSVPVVSTTANPLVFLYSAPPCPAGSRMKVEFLGNNLLTATPYRDCAAGVSMNFYLGGLRAGSNYLVRHTVATGAAVAYGPVLPLPVPAVKLNIASYDVVWPAADPTANGIVLQSTLFQLPVATDLAGNLVWYYAQQATVTRPEPGGTFLMLNTPAQTDPSQQVFREIDMAGIPLLETNAARVNEQLAVLNKHAITGFHHEAAPLPDGNLVLLGNTEQLLTGVQGPGAVDVLSDTILVLNRNLEVVWTWQALDHLDPKRLATTGDSCTAGGGGCPPFFLANQAHDWLHGNAVRPTPDGNLIYSTRSQDWVIKIDYRNGAGTGNILWRLGREGDFQVVSSDPQPWFSHQHDAGFADDGTLLLFDNGNYRQYTDPSARSRGQVWRLDEQARTATAVLNADLLIYSFALGAAQKLPNGNYHFLIGYVPDLTCYSVEVDPAGNMVYALHARTPEYRSFRMQDLYTP